MRLFLAALGLALVLAGCGSGGADQLLDTARLEEIQNNPEHARALYLEIAQKYPGTPQAKIATERLAALPPPAAP
ncbi:MAG TPA: hypothetical protein VKA21_14570, partial [Candidatus Binatia bacterium]|nr:hypothetical protein [Candidatus Binatia bacterium]